MVSELRNDIINEFLISKLPKNDVLHVSLQQIAMKLWFSLDVWRPSWIWPFFSKCSRVSQCYPAYICFGGPKGIESTEKKTFTVGAGWKPKICFGCQTMCHGQVIEALDSYAHGCGFNPLSQHGGVRQVLLQTIFSPHPGTTGTWQVMMVIVVCWT